ncbi:MAG TPA: DUF4349 domain-containing protein [Dehalococcoidia bacterium]|nr:DUF4349 domain-containing protein [Dehalococcoidia bacterium]
MLLRTSTFLALAVVSSIAVVACGDGAEGPGQADVPGQPGSADGATSSQPGGGSNAGSGSDLPSVSERKIVRNSTIDIAVENISDAVRKVDEIASAAQGYTSASTVEAGSDPSDGDESDDTASVTIRVPASSYPSVMNQLRDIAKRVLSENSQSSEVTDEYTDLQARLRNLTATENSYIELLSKAQNVTDILAIQEKLDPVRGEIEQVQGRINVLNDLTDLATITVRLQPPTAAPSDRNWVEDAWHAGWSASGVVLFIVGSGVIIGAVLLLWIVPLGLLGLAGWRLLGRRLTGFYSRLKTGFDNESRSKPEAP